MSKQLCTADLHIHTNLSFCAPRTTSVASYLEHCGREGITRLGMTNHLYAASKEGIQGLSYLEYSLQGKTEIERIKDKCGVEMLFGCESEIFWGEEAGLRPQDAKHFDYVLLAASHIFNFMHIYNKMDLSTPEKVRKLVLEQFKRACRTEYDIPSGICHPLYPICCPWEQEVVDGMTEEEMEECYSLAAEKGKSIEIHACIYRNGTQLDEDGISPSYVRLLTVAKKCGCKFHFGSDAHAPNGFTGVHSKLELAARRAGITEADLWELAR